MLVILSQTVYNKKKRKKNYKEKENVTHFMQLDI